LEKNEIWLNAHAFIWAFVCYFCMYAYRKPFTASKYEGYTLWSVDFKIMLVTAQVLGYTVSKFIGIKVISELNMRHRSIWIIVFIFSAEVTLILFGAIPPPYNIIPMFFNGLPLGMIWGLVFSYLEGRRTSEILGCGMCISFIISSGLVKSCGQAMLNHGLNQFWMPATVGAIFFPPLLLSVYLLECTPEPNAADIAARTERVAMTNQDRWRFFTTFAPGLILMTLFYTCLAAYRDFRDNFAAELWAGFGYADEPSVFAISEIIVAVITVIPIGLFMLIKVHLRTLIAYHILIAFAMILAGVFTLIINSGKLQALPYMIVTGVGLYLSYVPFNSIIFDLIIATFQYKANCGFMMYLCDSIGYLASVAVLFVKNFASKQESWIQFYYIFSYVVAIAGLGLILGSLAYWAKRYHAWTIVEAANDETEKKCEEEDQLEEKRKEMMEMREASQTAADV
jgi:hypothetical protein